MLICNLNEQGFLSAIMRTKQTEVQKLNFMAIVLFSWDNPSFSLTPYEGMVDAWIDLVWKKKLF